MGTTTTTTRSSRQSRTRLTSPILVLSSTLLLTLTCLLSSTITPPILIQAAPLNIADYPPASAVPPVDSPQMKQWLSEIDLMGAPTLNINSGEPPECPAVVDPNVCYWTCDDCSSDDVVECPDRNHWGITFDDGPTPATPELLDFLEQQKVKATFFLIGANVVQYPEMVVREVTQGHHLASHTWSHHALTTLSNEQIVAEIKWTEKAIMDATGYRVKYMRPPYGDVDNRVRFVLKKLGYTIVDWGGDTFDSNDWKMPSMSQDAVISHFHASIDQYVAAGSAAPTAPVATIASKDGAEAEPPAFNASRGFISLEHDLTAQTVAVAKDLIPYGLSKNLNIISIAECLHDASPYAATPASAAGATNTTQVPGSTVGVAGQPPGGGKDSNGVASGAAASLSLGRQHFLGGFLMSGQTVAGSGENIHSAVGVVSRWCLGAQKVAWSGLILGSFVAGLASL